MASTYGMAGRVAAAFIQSKLTPLVIVASVALGGLAVVALRGGTADRRSHDRRDGRDAWRDRG